MKQRGIRKVDVIVTVIVLIALYAIGIYNAIASNLTTDLAAMKEEDYRSGKYVEADIALNIGSYAQEESYRFHFFKTGTADYYVVSTSLEGTDYISLKTSKNTEDWDAMYKETENYLSDTSQTPAVRHIKGRLRKCDSQELKYLNEYMEGSEAYGVSYSEYYIQEIDAIDAYAILIAAFVVTLVMGLRFFLLTRRYRGPQMGQEIPPEQEESPEDNE